MKRIVKRVRSGAQRVLFALQLILLSTLLCCAGCVSPRYSATEKNAVLTNYLHKRVQIAKDCTLLEFASASDSSLVWFDTLYQDGQPTAFVEVNRYWLIRIFGEKPDLEFGTVVPYELFHVSRYHARVYYLSPINGGSFTHQTLIDPEASTAKLTWGPLATHPLEKGTAVYVERFQSLYGGWESMYELTKSLNVIVRVVLPGTTKEVRASCPLDDFYQIMKEQP